MSEENRAVLPLVDMAAVHRELGEELEAAVLAVVRSGRFAAGPVVETFEREFAGYLGCEHAVGLSNGTDALELAIRALGLEPGAEVLIPANTFIATAEAAVRAGVTPVFSDVLEGSGLIDLADAERRITARTRAIIPVHLYGRMVDMGAVREFAARHSLAVIEDAAQAHGARRDGHCAGTVGDIGCFSFYAGKNLGAFGEAGAAVTSDPELAERLALMRDHGQRGRYHHATLGFNCRMDPIQAAVLSVKLRLLDDWNERRRTVAGWYRELLPAGICDPALDQPAADVHHLFPILLEERDELAAQLEQAAVQTGIHYPQIVPHTPPFHRFAGDGRFPVAERRARLQLSLPMNPHLERADAQRIADAVTAFVEDRDQRAA